MTDPCRQDDNFVRSCKDGSLSEALHLLGLETGRRWFFLGDEARVGAVLQIDKQLRSVPDRAIR